MRMKTISESRTLRSVANEFLAYKKARKVRERTLKDYQKYIDQFIEQSENSMEIDVLKAELLNYFAEIPTTSPARYNHPYQYLHALFEWCLMQDYLPFNPFDKLGLRKIRDEGKVQPAGIKDKKHCLKKRKKGCYGRYGYKGSGRKMGCASIKSTTLVSRRKNTQRNTR